ncbi:sigma-70 family RNA polymerase sigma factor [Clostridioides difficile]
MEGILGLNKYKSKKLEFRDVEQAIKGDKDAFINIIKVNKEYLYKTAYMYVKDDLKALEILQETITRGYTGINKLKEPSFFKTWITRILINVAIDTVRRESKIIDIDETVCIEVSKSISIEERLDLYNAVDLLRDKYKTIVIMKYFNDMKIQDISILMDIPENTVKTYLNRAKKELRSILREGYLNE